MKKSGLIRKNLPLLASLIFGVLLVSAYAEAADRYTLLEPIAGFSTEGAAPTFSVYLRGIFVFLVRVSIVGAVVMLVIAGAEYTGIGIPGIGESAKGDAKKKIENVIYGLLGAVMAYFILNLINPALVNFQLKLDKIDNQTSSTFTQAQPKTGGGGGGLGGVQSKAGVLIRDCNNCGSLVNAGIPVKSGAGTQLNAGMAEKLEAMNAKMQSAGVQWEVTEAYPPTVSHKEACHQDGTCIDANPSSRSQNIKELNAFVDAAKSAGLTPVYEVKTQAEVDSLIRAGFKGTSGVDIKAISAITGPHFSVYNK